MCGRYVLAKDYEELKARFVLTPLDFARGKQSDFSIKPRYNIAPQQENPVIVKGGADSSKGQTRASAAHETAAHKTTPTQSSPPSSLGKGAGGLGFLQHMELMQWGLVPHWAKDSKIGYKMINARAESVAEKPSFREPFKKQRCLVPATGFYEWVVEPKDPKRKTPIFIHLKKQELYAFAGLYSIWGEGDKLKKTYTIITTEANDYLRKYHDRMPVILSRDEEEKWLDPNADTSELLKLLDPYPADQMEAYEVSTMVNKPVNDSPENIKPVKAA